MNERNRKAIVITLQDEPPNWTSDSDMGLESISEPDIDLPEEDDEDGYEDTEGGDEELLLPGMYRAIYAFEPEGTAEMKLEEEQVVHVVGRGGGVGWAVVEKEGGDFYEFLACNVAVAVVALVVLFARSKRLQAMHARQLAARIGLVRGTPSGWASA